MNTIDNIIFDIDYSCASTSFLLLHDHLPTLIKLQHADILTYIHRFENLFICQEYVDNNRQKMVTLFTTDRNFLNWDTNIKSIDHNLWKIFIYCDTIHGHMNVIEYQGRYQKKIREIFMNEKLDFYLLSAGLDHLKTICDELDEDDALREKFKTDGKRILNALGDYFGSKITKLSYEAS